MKNTMKYSKQTMKNEWQTCKTHAFILCLCYEKYITHGVFSSRESNYFLWFFMFLNRTKISFFSTVRIYDITWFIFCINVFRRLYYLCHFILTGSTDVGGNLEPWWEQQGFFSLKFCGREVITFELNALSICYWQILLA